MSTGITIENKGVVDEPCTNGYTCVSKQHNQDCQAKFDNKTGEWASEMPENGDL